MESLGSSLFICHHFYDFILIFSYFFLYRLFLFFFTILFLFSFFPFDNAYPKIAGIVLKILYDATSISISLQCFLPFDSMHSSQIFSTVKNISGIFFAQGFQHILFHIVDVRKKKFYFFDHLSYEVWSGKCGRVNVVG